MNAKEELRKQIEENARKNIAQSKILNNKNQIETKLEVDLIKSNPYQPRLEIKNSNLSEMVKSIKEYGLLQPVPVAKVYNEKNDFEYILIAGHTRLEAHKALNMKYIKVHIFENITKKQLAILGTIENIQRNNLDIIEISIQYNHLLEIGFYNSVTELAEAVSKDVSSVSKIVKLLNLPNEIREHIRTDNGVKDVKLLNMLLRVKDKKKCSELYFYVIEKRPSREEFKKIIDNVLGVKEKKEIINHCVIKKSKNSYNLTIPKVDEEKLKKIEEFIDKII